MSAAAPAAAAQPPTQTDTDTVTEAHTDQPSNIDSTNVTSSDEMELPSHNSTYKRKEYWEERFSKEEKYEWLSGYGAVRDLLRPLLKPEHKILHLGCGNSDLSRDLYRDGYHHITNIDFSSACIAAQQERNRVDCPEMTWRVMDMLELSQHFERESFDIVLDKCTLDALVVDEGDPWNPRDEVRTQVDQVLSGVSHVLKSNGGMYLQMSFGQPVHRLNNYFEKEKYGWNVTVHNWGDEKGFGYFFYKMIRTPDTKSLQEFYKQKALVKAEEDERVRLLAERNRQYESDDEQDTAVFAGMEDENLF